MRDIVVVGENGRERERNGRKVKKERGGGRREMKRQMERLTSRGETDG